METANKEIKEFIIESKSQIKYRLWLTSQMCLKFFCNPSPEMLQGLFTLILQNAFSNKNANVNNQTCVSFKDIIINIDYFLKVKNKIKYKLILSQPFIWNIVEGCINNTLSPMNEYCKTKEFHALSKHWDQYVQAFALSDNKRFGFKVEDTLKTLHYIYHDFKKDNLDYRSPSFANLFPKFIKHDEHGNRIYDMGNVSLHNGYASNNIFTETHSFNTFKMLFED